MADHSICLSPQCGAWADGQVKACPRCGGPMRARRGVTWGGWVMLGMGLFLLLLMGTITAVVAPMLLRPGIETAGGGTFTGTAQQAWLILGLFALIMLFGLASTIHGGMQVATGRQSNWLIVLILALAGTLVIGGLFTVLALA